MVLQSRSNSAAIRKILKYYLDGMENFMLGATQNTRVLSLVSEGSKSFS